MTDRAYLRPPRWRPDPTPEETHAAVDRVLGDAARWEPSRPKTWPRELPKQPEHTEAADYRAWLAAQCDTWNRDRVDTLGIDGPWNRYR